MAIIPVHTMRDQPDYVGTMQRGMAFGNQLRQQRQEEERRNKLAQLGSQAYGAQGADRQALIGQAVGVDMEQGLALGGALRQNDMANMSAEDAQAKRLRGAAKFMMQAIESNDPAKIKGAHQAVSNFMGGFGQQFPAEFTPEMVPQIQEVLARTAYLEGDFGPRPTGVKEFEMMAAAAGYKPGTPEFKKAAQIALGAEGRASSAGIGFFEIEGQDGRKRLGRRNPRDGSVEILDEASNTFVPFGGGKPQQAQPPTRADMEADVQLANDMTAAGVPEAQVMALLEARGKRAREAGIAQVQVPTAVSGNPVIAVGRSPEEEAAAVAQAKAAVEAQTAAEIERAKIYGRQSGEAEANAKFGSDESRKAAREAAMKLPQLQNAARGLVRIRAALEALSRGRFGGLVDTGPIDQIAIRYTPEGREMESAVGGIQNSMLALTRVPGVGSQSDLELRVANLQYPSLDNPPEVNARTMQNLEAVIADLQAAYQNVIASGNRQPAPRDYQQSAPAQAPRRLKFNPQTGRIE